MCGRFVRHSGVTTLTELIGGLHPPNHADVRPSYNIAPSQAILSARNSEDGTREWASLSWGLLPFWAKEAKVNKPINARAESVHTKPYFRAAFKHRRCLVPCDGWYEWQKTPSGKQPHYFTLKQEQPFCFAGLWERWTPKNGDQPLETCCIMTTDANAFAAKVHNRMPVIVHPKDYERWLDPATDKRDDLEDLLGPYHWVEQMDGWPVSRYVNKPANNDERCVERVDVN